MDIALHYIVRGEGFPLILLHGNGEDGSCFAKQIDAFAKHARVFAVDTRGHGKSPRGAAPFTISQFADDLKDFLDEHSIEKADILGFSDGGNIAMQFALRHPKRVRKLVLNGANLNPGGIKPMEQLLICMGYGMVCLIVKLNKKVVAKKELLGLMVTQPHVKPEELAAVECPTLIVAGTRDMVRHGHTMEIHRAIAGSELAIVPGDHFVAAKNSAEFNRRVVGFLWGAG